MSAKWVTAEANCYPGEFPDCGCHYTTDDDGVHFCPMHKAAPDLLAACKEAIRTLNRHCTKIDDGSAWNKTQRMLGAAIAKAEQTAPQ